MLTKYRIYCEDEADYFEAWLPEEPTTCPNNNTHTITTEKTITLEEIDLTPKNTSGVQRVQETPRPLWCTTVWNSRGDDITDVDDIGGMSGSPERLFFHHIVGDPVTEEKILKYNIAPNETYLHDGSISFEGCKGDMIMFELWVDKPEFEAGVDTNYASNGILIVPAAGDGDVNITADITALHGGLVFIPNTDEGNRPSLPCFWDADWNPTTKVFENITPNPEGTGYYAMFNIQYCLNRFAPCISLTGGTGMNLDSHDTDQMGQGMFLKVTTTTHIVVDRIPDHEWSLAINLLKFRDNSC